MEVSLKYGRETRRLRVGEAGLRVSVLTPGRTSDLGDEPRLMRDALAMQQAEIYLVSALPPGLARSLGFRPFSDVNAALDAALSKAAPNPFVVVMPEGGSVLPSLGAPLAAG